MCGGGGGMCIAAYILIVDGHTLNSRHREDWHVVVSG